MKTLFMDFLTAIEGLIAKIKVDLEAIGSALWPAIEAAFTAAEQAEINALIPIAEQVANGINNSENPKQLFADVLAGVETSLIASGKTFILTLAAQAVTLAIDNLKGAEGTGNAGNMPAGSSTGT